MRLRTLLAATLLALGTAPIATAAAADPAGCDAQCQWQWDQQRQNTLPRGTFYDPPDPLRPAPAGTLIRAAFTTEYQVDGASVGATRILYHSRTSAGRDVAASGVLLVPPGRAPRGGWPVVVDAHGTSGMGLDCAPSLMRDLYHGDQMARFTARGWAVVAPDYAGLGTTGDPEVLNKTAEAEDLVAALRAAHQTRPDLGGRWVAWGHSQGGGAVLGLAEQQLRAPEPGYLGAVVTSPAADLERSLANAVDTPGLGGFAPLIAAGAQGSDHRIRLDRVLTPAALSRIDVTRTGCLGVLGAVYADLTGTALVRPDYLQEPHFASYLRRNSTGTRPIGGPLLLLQGTADVIIPQAITDDVAARLCGTGARVDYRTYPGLTHDSYPGQSTGIDDGAMPDIIAWVADRFAGETVPVHGGCVR
ncbi:alpha/beta fold hydrolase [Amycolatopsis sp. NPDC048633]|uniref:lipase family protein n=1 Tax=Amycolatopsis sp. NPDC048633 TaxID=3157095 RepID=UPI0033FC5BA2